MVGRDVPFYLKCAAQKEKRRTSVDFCS